MYVHLLEQAHENIMSNLYISLTCMRDQQHIRFQPDCLCIRSPATSSVVMAYLTFVCTMFPGAKWAMIGTSAIVGVLSLVISFLPRPFGAKHARHIFAESVCIST